MAYTLYTGQIIEALRFAGHPAAEWYVARLHALTADAGDALASHLGVGHGALSELWGGHAAMSFGPAHEGQELPDALVGMDAESEWGEWLCASPSTVAEG